MGSQLIVTFTNYTICATLKTKFLVPNLHAYKPAIYSRYIDDIFIVTPNLDNLLQLKTAHLNLTQLSFTQN